MSKTKDTIVYIPKNMIMKGRKNEMTIPTINTNILIKMNVFMRFHQIYLALS